jgi:formamidopyrimidine-DNA glycosylase
MPEIAEVARIVHYIRKHLVGKTLAKVIAVDDANVYGRVGTSGAEFQKSLTGKKVVGAGQQGKYFWIVMDKPPHPLMHFGMTGWLKIKSEDTYYYRKKEGEDEWDEEWPPRFWKFHLETKGEPVVEAAFVDSRRFARVRLLDCATDEIRKISPLKENGPDPVVDKELVTLEWLMELCRRKKIPIKALLLDQANISGIGNWVGDEIMYHAKMHPEQYSNTLSDDQLKQLHESIHYICDTAVDLLADSDKFPEDWLFKHRWGKGKKDAPKTLPSGEKITFLTVGGRTSAVVPSIQKKTGPAAKEMTEAESGGEAEETKKKTSGAKAGKKRKSTDDTAVDVAPNGETSNVNGAVKEKASAKRERKSRFKEELSEEDVPAEGPTTKSKKRKSAPLEEAVKSSTTANKPGKAEKPVSKRKKTDEGAPKAASGAKRRSTRLSRG